MPTLALTDPAPISVLLLSDTHVGFDLPVRLRTPRRRRGDDFLDNFERALRPALRGEVDVVIHAGDVFDQPDPPAAVTDLAYALLRAVAQRGIPTLVLPGNHERARLPCPLLCRHPKLWTFDRPRTFTVDVRGQRLAIGGFPYARRVRHCFRQRVDSTQLLQTHADARLLVIHHCVEGARVSLPDGGDYVFRDADDVVAARDLPDAVAAVLSGHIHRHQVIHCPQARAAPVVYCGSVERTAFAEMRETKGFVRLHVGASDRGGRVEDLRFCALPARPMVRRCIDPEGDVDEQLRVVAAAVPRDAVLRLEVPGPPRSVPGLSAAAVRGVLPMSMNVYVVFEGREPKAGRLSRSRRGARRRPTGAVGVS